MTKNAPFAETRIARLKTGVRNLDALFHGGPPLGSVIVLSGPPGSGKTILAQQVCFANATPRRRALYFNTLSEPTAKTIRYLTQFGFFDPTRLESAVKYVDLGRILRTEGLEPASALFLENLRKVKPAIVVVDSFKVFDDLAKSPDELRKFGYQLAVNLMAWETTAFLLGEYGPAEHETNPLFSIVDGLVRMTHRESSGEHQRFIQILKMRGTDHSTDEHAFVLTKSGLEVFAPRVTIRREPRVEQRGTTPRVRTNIGELDTLLGEGIPRGSSLLVAGVAGTGKTLLLLEFIYRGALAGEKGVLFSFEETEERLRATAKNLGWDLDAQIAQGMATIVFVPQPDILVERHLLMMREMVERLGAKRVAIDSVSVFLHKIRDPQVAREKVFQLASIVQNASSVGFFAADVPYGSNRISRFGVEETVVDGVILLSSTEEALERDRYVEVYKLRNTAHLRGRHAMTIGAGGMRVFPRYVEETPPAAAPLDAKKRLPTGVRGLDRLLGGGLLARSTTLVSGSPGIGKSTLATQFVLAGPRRERAVFVALEEGPAQVLASAASCGLALGPAVKSGKVEIVHLSPERVRSAQFSAIIEERVSALGAQRVVIDGMNQIAGEIGREDELRRVFHGIIGRLRALGATTLLTLEVKALERVDAAVDLGLSPLADNLVMLRYAATDAGLAPTLTIVKTRGSTHDRDTHPFEVGPGGVHLAQRR